MKITAAVLRSAEQPYSIETIQLPAIADDEVLVRIVSAGICHTDSILQERRVAVVADHPWPRGCRCGRSHWSGCDVDLPR